LTIPDTGDLLYIDFDPAVGHEQLKRRPGLVLSPAAFNRAFGVAFVAPVTSKSRGHDFEVPLPDGLAVHGSVMVQHLKSLDWRQRRAEHVGRAPASVVATAVFIVKGILG
jgi:mRNA interferase MazF